MYLGKRSNKIYIIGEYVKYFKKLFNLESEWEIRLEGNLEYLNEYLFFKLLLCDLRKLLIYY